MHNDPHAMLQLVRSRQVEDHRWAEQQRLARSVRRQRGPWLRRSRTRVRPMRIRPAVRLSENW